MQTAYAQTDESKHGTCRFLMKKKLYSFAGFAIAVIGIFLFLARDIILRKKTSYDKEELRIKKRQDIRKISF